LLDSLRLRLYAAFGFIIAVTLGVAGFAFFFPLGGYREDQAFSTLREVALPVYYNVTFFSRANVTVRELTLYFQQQAQETDIIVLVVDRSGRVVRDAAAEPSLLNETFDLGQSTLSEDFRRLYEGTHTTQDGRDLLFVAVPLPPRFALGQLQASAVVVALPKDSAGSVIGDLTPRLLLAGWPGWRQPSSLVSSSPVPSTCPCSEWRGPPSALPTATTRRRCRCEAPPKPALWLRTSTA
jgi:hypothetical protein